MEKNKVKCPKCGNELDVNEILYKNIESAVAERHQAEIRRLAEERDAAEKAMKVQLEKARSEAAAAAKAAARKELADENKTLLDELREKTASLSEMQKYKGEAERLKRESDLAVNKALADKESETTERMKQELAQQRAKLESEQGLKLKETEEIIRGLKAEMEKLRQKAEQGSMQIQGEVQELTTEELLRSLFPTDDIKPVGKGQPGADSLQTVITRTGKEAGKVYYESKRTQNFDKKWLAKLKNDNLEVNADLLVLLTKTMPADKTSYYLDDGVWVCPFSQAKDFCVVMREMVLKAGAQRALQENKEGKAELLYNYLTSLEFKNLFESILNSFRQMRESHEAEKKKLVKLWSEREKLLDLMIKNAAKFYGSIKGLGGADIKPIDQLELQGEDEGKSQKAEEEPEPGEAGN